MAARSDAIDETTKQTRRVVRFPPALDAVWQDLRYAARGYRRTPGFTVVALLTLTLAIGANTAIFSLLNALVLRDLPVRDPGSLVQVATSTRTSSESYLTFPMFRELARGQQAFAEVMGGWGNSVMIVDTGTTLTNGLVWVSVQLVKSLLFGITPHDSLTLLVAPASLLLVAIVACLLPAARAAKVDPMIALRAE